MAAARPDLPAPRERGRAEPLRLPRHAFFARYWMHNGMLLVDGEKMSKSLGNFRTVQRYDTTLRDGAQTQGVDFSVADKRRSRRALDRLGIDYIEGGWPGANPTDDAFFAEPPELHHARFAAFGMTRSAGRSAANDPGLSRPDRRSAAVCLVGKSSTSRSRSRSASTATRTSRMIEESIAERKRGPRGDVRCRAFLRRLQGQSRLCARLPEAALDAGARWVVLCDTNGGTLPHEVERIVGEVVAHGAGDRLGIHTHNDTENAVANTLAAIRAGVRQVQGTLNGWASAAATPTSSR
jgi:2-isopropylmalate synthase